MHVLNTKSHTINMTYKETNAAHAGVSSHIYPRFFWVSHTLGVESYIYSQHKNCNTHLA